MLLQIMIPCVRPIYLSQMINFSTCQSKLLFEPLVILHIALLFGLTPDVMKLVH